MRLVVFWFLSFFLDKKRNKKVKANAIAPQALPGQRTRTVCQLKLLFVYGMIGWRCFFVLCEVPEGAAFSLAFLTSVLLTQKAKKRRWKLALNRLNWVKWLAIILKIFFEAGATNWDWVPFNECCQHLFFAYSQAHSFINQASEKAVPPVSPGITQLRLPISPRDQ